MRPKQGKQLMTMVRQLSRAPIDDANAVLDKLDPTRRSKLIRLLANRGEPAWLERLPTPQQQQRDKQQSSNPSFEKPSYPKWLEERLSPLPAANQTTFFNITDAAINALKAAADNSAPITQAPERKPAAMFSREASR